MSGRARRLVIFAASGRQGRFDQPGHDAELFERLAGQFLPYRTAAARFDCDGYHSRQTVSDERRLQARAERLLVVIEQLCREFECPVTLMGLSLGALAICEVASRRELARVVDTLLLCSACIERPTVVMPHVRNVHLVYGAYDGVSYAGADQEVPQAEPPEVYGPRCGNNLIVMPETNVSLDVLADRGHFLLRPGAHAPDDDTIARLMTLAAPLEYAHRHMEVRA